MTLFARRSEVVSRHSPYRPLALLPTPRIDTPSDSHYPYRPTAERPAGPRADTGSARLVGVSIRDVGSRPSAGDRAAARRRSGKPLAGPAWCPTLCTAQPLAPGPGDRLVHKVGEVLQLCALTGYPTRQTWPAGAQSCSGTAADPRDATAAAVGKPPAASGGGSGRLGAAGGPDAEESQYGGEPEGRQVRRLGGVRLDRREERATDRQDRCR